MNLPVQVAAQAAYVEQYDKALAQAANPVAPAPDAPTPTPTPSAPAAPAEPAPPPPAPTDDLVQKYRSLQGQFRAKNEEIAALRGAVQELTEKVEVLSKAPTPAPAPAAPVELVTEADRQAFGDDMCNFAMRIAQQLVDRRVEVLTTQVAALEAKLGKTESHAEEAVRVAVQSDRERYFEKLDNELPGWEQIQLQAQVQEWLSRRVPGSQSMWNDVLVAAAGRNDFEATKEVFDEIFACFPHLRSSSATAAPPAPAPANPLELEVDPVRPAAPSAPTPPAQKRVYKASEYEAESMKVIRLRQQNRYDEADRLEAELNLALHERRVTP